LIERETTFWNLPFHFEHSYPALPCIPDVKIRFGLSVKVGFKDDSPKAISYAYNKILSEHGLTLESQSYKHKRLLAAKLKL